MTLDRSTVRRLALAVAIAWFVYWGQRAYQCYQARDAAERARFLAEGRRDWAEAQLHEGDRRAAARDLVRSACRGFLLPLCVLVLVEGAWAIQTHPSRRS